MRQRAISVRAALTRHPWAISIMQSRTSPGPATLRHHDAVLGCCRQAGFSVELAAHAFSLIDSYIYGFVLQEVNLPFTKGTTSSRHRDDDDQRSRSLPAPRRTDPEIVLQPGYAYGNEFDYGLDLILDSLERTPGTAQPVPSGGHVSSGGTQ